MRKLFNSDKIIEISNHMFEKSKPLSDFERNVLIKTMRRLSKTKPTLPNRK